MTRHPNYKHWPSEKRDWYDKVSGKIEKHGHTILGTVDGKGNLERPFAYSIGASFSTGAEVICFFPLKGKGLEIISGVINKVISALKEKNLDIESQIINDENIYYLPIALVVLDDEEKEMVESVWPQQLLRDSLLAEYSTDDHKLLVLIATDKDGHFPWEPGCSSYWPDICPHPITATAQVVLTGDDSLLSKLEDQLGKDKNTNKKDYQYFPPSRPDKKL